MKGARRWLALAWGVAVVAAGALFGDTLRWLWRVPYSGEERRLNLLLLVGLLGLLGGRALRRLRSRGPAGAEPPVEPSPTTVAAAPLLLFLLATTGHAVIEHTLQASSLTALLALFAGYGFWGCLVSPARFAAGRSGLLLLAASLPFAALAEGYVGLGARLLTAEVVQQVLSTLHIAVLPAHTILVLERGIAHVDIPCSGLRSLWSGLLGYLLLAWLEQRRIGGRFLLGLLGLQGLLLAANLLRVFGLVYVGHVVAAPRLAEALHVPLGLFGFAVVLTAAFFYLRYAVPSLAASPSSVAGPPPARPRPERPVLQTWAWQLPSLPRRYLALTVAGFLSLLALADRLLPRPAREAPRPPPSLPASLAAVPVPLSAGEQEIFGRFGAQAGKWRLPGGSLIVVRAPGLTAFRAHHPPEVCLLAAGLKVVQTLPLTLAPGAVARHLLLSERASSELRDSPDRPGGRQGLYWFQSASATTPDIVSRIFRQLLRPEPWLMVTLLSDAPAGESPRPAEEALIPLARQIHAALSASLTAAASAGAATTSCAMPPERCSTMGEPLRPQPQPATEGSRP